MKKKFTLFGLVWLLIGIAFIGSCKKDPVIPTLTTTVASNITINSATAGGEITSDGGATVTARGICWSSSTGPDISDSHTTDNTGTGSFLSNITNLTPNTPYYIRAYATNKVGTAYGNELSFTTTPIVVATLTTTQITSITLTTAITGGDITSDGFGAITARGVCWSTTANPTIANDTTMDGTGTGSFVSHLEGLTPGTTYYVRSYATNSAGTAYGAERSFPTVSLAVPTLTTASVTSHTFTSAVSGGDITYDGGAAVTARGVCWATAVNPTTANSKTTNGTGSGAFTSNITGLSPGVTYHVRAYATNSVGTAYGADIEFSTTPVGVPTLTTTTPGTITQTSAVSGGNITADGGGSVTARGVCWATTTNPTIANSKTTDGTGTGTFTSNISGLTPGTTYYVRAYATNSAGTAYGDEKTFPTNPVLLATLTTTAVTSITQTTAVSGGNITADGGGGITARGVCWSTTLNPTTADSKTTNGTGTGTFTSNLTGMTAGITYHVRAYATNSAGTAYGNDISFPTDPVVVPTLTTNTVTSITATTAVSGGDITSDGAGAITAKGVCWATTTNPTTASSHTTDGTGSADFTSDISGLTAGTIYYVRAYATNSAGTSYGNQRTFTSLATAVPNLTTTVITAITTTSAQTGGNITLAGAGTITARGVCWATTPNPTTSNPHTSNGTGTGSFDSDISGLTHGTIYYVRAYATNNFGTGYGNELVFGTKLGDVDGNTYDIVVIGSQVWMKENLKTTKYNNGNSIGTTATPLFDITGEATPSYQWPNFDADMNDVTDTYGRLYTWYAVIDARNVCPSGWHVPSYGELGTLISAVGTSDDAGIALKEAGLTHWQDPNTGATNSSGFTALPSGYRRAEGIDAFVSLHVSSNHWSIDPEPINPDWAYGLHMIYNDIIGTRWGFFKNAGCSVRCLKD